MTARTLLLAALLVPFACDVADDPETRDAELIPSELVTNEEEEDDASCGADLMRVDPGEHNAFFSAVSPQEIELDPELDFTINPDGTTLHANNGQGGIELTCRCEDNCSGGTSSCQVNWDAHEADCAGSCEKPGGGSCGACAWHYGDIPPPRDSGVPGAKKPAQPGGGQNALP